MEDARSRQFFLRPAATFHRQYEALRAFFVDQRPLKGIAEQFGYRYSSLRSLVSRFRAQLEADEAPPFLPFHAPDRLPARARRRLPRVPKRRPSPMHGC